MIKAKKIGILTWYNHGNYGSALQAYALKTYLEKNGYSAQIIPYIPQWERSSNKVGVLKRSKRIIKKILGFCFEWLWFRKNIYCDSFVYFRLKYLKLRGFCTETDIAEYVYRKGFSIIISGSDQIWNPSFVDYTFLQNFIRDKKIRKISYAASLGVETMPDAHRDMYKGMLGTFYAISVREYAGKKILDDMGFSVDVLIDPALLLSVTDYRKIYKPLIGLKKKYVFCYILRTQNHTYKDSIREYASKHNLDVIGISFEKDDYKWMENVSFASPREWLWLIDHAAVVMTNSYHATIFSLVFHSDFFTFVRFKTNDKYSQNSRINQLISYFGIEKYVIDGKVPNVEKYDFSLFENNLLELQLKSYHYLKDNLN